MRHPCLVLAILFGAASADAGVPALRWPDATAGALCNGLSLQQCIDAVPEGAHLRVVRGGPPSPQYHAIPGTLTITRPLHLSVDPGVDAVLPEGADIVCRPAAGLAGHCQIEGFVLRRGRILVEAFDNLPGVVRISNNRVGIPARAQALAAIEIGISTSRAASPAWDVQADRNVLTSTGAGGASGIDIFNADDGIGALTARVTDNLVESRHPQGMRIGISLARNRGEEWRIERNVVRGSTDTTTSSSPISFSQVRAGVTSPLRIADNLVLAVPDASGAGIAVYGLAAPLALRVVNNSVIGGAVGIEINEIAAGGHIDLHNNLIVGQSFYGISLGQSTQAILRESRNALHANTIATFGFTLSPSSSLADPQIEGREFPRPRSASPLIDGGSNGEWSDGAGDARGDVAGDPRQMGAAIDIGALEWNRHRVFQHNVEASNLTANYTLLPAEISASDLPIAVAVRAGSSPQQQDQVLGMWNPQAGRMAIYHQQQLPMSIGQGFIVARLGEAAPFAFTQDSSVADTCVQVSGLSPLSVAIAMHRYEGPSGSAILPSPISLLRNVGTGWRICDERFEVIPAGRRFHLVAAPEGSANAWYTPALEQARSTIALAHRWLDATPCALPVVGRGHDLSQSFVPFNPTPFAVQHEPPSGPGAPSRWVVHAVGTQPGAVFPLQGGSFHAMLSGAQALRCRVDADLLRNGFE